jgi:nitroimidazol reductase NimA-like FMN-containing flavoprotein (pyridoxamine 5'-phosphate oxidase superfamily)
MALVKLGQEELRTFLDQTTPALIGVVGTLGEDGFPHLVPVWYRYDGERFHIWTLETRAWVKNIPRDHRVGFSVHENEVGGSRGVSTKGHAQITTSDGEWVTQEIRRLTYRYVSDPAEVEPYIDRWRHLRTIVSITPEAVSAWKDVVESGF